jgi:ferredoxin-NADP reductase
VPSSVLGFVTTIHLALASLRNHRSVTRAPLSSLAAVSLLFAATPWLFPSPIGIAFGLLAHLAWFIACERLVPTDVLKGRGATKVHGTAAPVPVASSAKSVAASVKPKGFIQVPVLAVFNETSDIKTIRMARPEGFEYAAGQFIAIRVRVDGKDCSRCYSVSSPPYVRGYFEISVKRQGLVSNALHATARPGALMSIRTPNGAFKYPSGDDRPIVLVAGGVGITPLMSMLRHAVHDEPSRPVTLLYSARTESDFAFRDELASLARRHPQLRVQLASTNGTSSEIYPGRIDAELIRTIVPDIAHSIAFLCGPGPMIDQMKVVLAGLGVPAGQIRHEVFEAAVAASAAQAEQPPPAVEAVAPPPSRLSMNCAKTGKTVPVEAGQTLLEAAEAGGVAIEFLCRAGICGTCRTRVVDGDVECTSDALDADERASGIVLACVSHARSNCTVDA